MIIRGGKIFVMENDVLPKVTITDATIIMETADSSLDGLKEFISERTGRGSEMDRCTLVPIGDWAKQKSKEGISKAKKRSASEKRTDHGAHMQRFCKNYWNGKPMRFVNYVLGVLLVATASMLLMGDAILYACDTRGKFENNGTTYVCHKSTAPTGKKE